MPPRTQAQQAPGLNPAGTAQTPNPSLRPAESLRILVLEGQGASHDIRERVSASPVVEVRDDNGQPVEGADVVFELPAVGPGGSFAGQRFSATARTNEQGQATVTFMPNLETGRFNIRVSATSVTAPGVWSSPRPMLFVRQHNRANPNRAFSNLRGGKWQSSREWERALGSSWLPEAVRDRLSR